MELAIDFFEGPPPMEIGSRTRFKVGSVSAGGGPLHSLAIKRVSFTFAPTEWAG